jgi:hypothetical protein
LPLIAFFFATPIADFASAPFYYARLITIAADAFAAHIYAHCRAPYAMLLLI